MYYVYVLFNPITALPFYVGVGKQNRIYGKEKAAEIKEKRRLKKIQYWEEKRKPTDLEQ